jgi:hypothetical protein
MNVEEITIHVDSEAAQAYRGASEEQRRKLDLLLSLRLREATHPGVSLQEVMRDLGQKAQERGMTPEILQAILNDR